MSYDYLNDIFGEHRGHDTRYTPHEKHAIEVIRLFYNNEIDRQAFAEEIHEIRETFLALTKDADGNPVIDQDVPLWLNGFLFKFIRWDQYRMIQEAAKSKPELTEDPRWPGIMDDAASYEREFHQAMKYCIEEWNRIHSQKQS